MRYHQQSPLVRREPDLPSCEVIGPDERVSPLDALKAITINAAYQYFEEKQKGSIEPGKLPDLVIFSANSLKVAPDTIKVLETSPLFLGRSVFASAHT